MTRRTAPGEAESSVRTARAAFSSPPPVLRPDRAAAPPPAREDGGVALPPCGPDEIEARLAPLPVAALGLDADTVRLLDRLGLKVIGALAAVPRAALMRRFADRPAAANPLVLLDRATGRLSDPVDGPPDRRRPVARARLAEPVPDAAPHLPALCAELRVALAEAGHGARLLKLTVYRIDGTWRSAEVATAGATRDAEHMRRLLEGRLDRIDPGFGFDLLTLEALRTEPLDARQGALAGRPDRAAEVDALLDRLTARLGPGRVMWTHWRESHLPERVERPVPALGARPAAPPAIARERPLRLFDPAEEVHVLYAVPEGPPTRFVWRRVRLDVARHEGPERLAPEWWRERAGARLRDYYKVEVTDGRRLWLYREGVLGDGRGRTVRVGASQDGWERDARPAPEDGDRTGPPPDAARTPFERPAPDRSPVGPGIDGTSPAKAVANDPRDSQKAPPPTVAFADVDAPRGPDGNHAPGRAAPAAADEDRAGKPADPPAPPRDGPPLAPVPERAGAGAPPGSAAVLPFRRPMADGEQPAPPLAAPAVLTGPRPAAPPEAAEAHGHVLAFSGTAARPAGLRTAELPPRWFVHGLFA